MDKLAKKHQEILRRPQELIYRSCYAPADLHSMLATADGRSRIRRLPPAQLYFSIKELDDDEITTLLPHITEEQWTTLLDLDLWQRDRVVLDGFLSWERHLLGAEDPVAKKILRATDSELWQLAILRELEVYARSEEDEFEGEPEEREPFVTPDGRFLIGLPRNSERARLIRLLLTKLYQLDSEWASFLVEEARFRTPVEVEEEAYQNRRRRVEDLGFQDYFTAIEIYSPLGLTDRLPGKSWESRGEEPSGLPASLRALESEGPLLVLQAIAAIPDPQVIEELIEELFFVCNKLLSADRISPERPRRVKRGIRKALSGINLGLSVWSDSNLQKAVSGIQQHYLVSFFRIGYGQLIELKKQGQGLVGQPGIEPGSYLESALEGFLGRFPVLTEQREGRIRRRFIDDQDALRWAYQLLDEIRGPLQKNVSEKKQD